MLTSILPAARKRTSTLNSYTKAFALAAMALMILGVGTNGAVVSASTTQGTVPSYNHIFLLIMENEGYQQVIGSQYAPILTGLANDYGVATNYRGVADPSEPNYVAMLGGSFFGINSDNPYWYPGQTVNAPNLMSQLQGAGLTWRGYFQNMPYPGYSDYCYPAKCNGIPDADTQYVSKHNGIVNFADMQTPSEMANMYPIGQLQTDLASGNVPSFSYIVPDECHDMHGAPPWCVDSDNTNTVEQSWLISQGDAYLGQIVNEITSSSMWATGTNAIVVTFDEGNSASSRVATIVIGNHGVRGVADNTAYNHYSLLATIEQAFGLGCLLNSCTATAMAPLFAVTGSTSTPTLPAAYNFPSGSNTVSAQSAGSKAASVSLTGLTGWNVVPSYSYGSLDNDLAGVAAASQTDAWAVGAYYPSSSNVLNTLAEHWDGSRWTAYQLPNVGTEENVLLGVSMPATGEAWAVGYYVNGNFQQQTLVEHYDGSTWSVVPSPSPGALQNIFFGVAAISDTDVWAVGGYQGSNGVWQTLTEHWDGSTWTVVSSPDPGSTGDQLYAVSALSSGKVFAVGQQAGTGAPAQALTEQWNGKAWSVVASAADSSSALPLSVTATAAGLTTVGQQEPFNSGYTTYVATGAPGGQTIQTTPNLSTIENDLFGVTTASDGTSWAVGWAVDATTGNHDPMILEGSSGTWTLASSPNLGTGDDGLAAVAAIPGGGVWAVGVLSAANGNGNYGTLIEYHP